MPRSSPLGNAGGFTSGGGGPTTIVVAGAAPGTSAASSPRLILATHTRFFNAVASANGAARAFMYSRQRVRLAPGNWEELRPVLFNSRRGGIDGINSNETDEGLLDAIYFGTFEMHNGVPATSANYFPFTNQGGARADLTFGGCSSVLMRRGQVIVGDPVLPAQFGLTSFNGDDPELWPFVRNGFMSPDGVANLSIATAQDEMGPQYYQSERSDNGNPGFTTKAALLAHVRESGVSGDFGAYGQAPMLFGFVGRPASGQRSYSFGGSSTPAGDGDQKAYVRDVTNTLPAGGKANADLRSWPLRFLRRIGMPGANGAQGGSNLNVNWGVADTAAGLPRANFRRGQTDLVKYFDVHIEDNTTNDAGVTNLADYTAAVRRKVAVYKRENPHLKFGWTLRPWAVLDGNTTTTPPTEAGQTERSGILRTDFFPAILALKAEGVIDFILDLRGSAGYGSDIPGKEWAFCCSGSPVEPGTATGGTTTSIVDASKNWPNSYWTDCWVSVGGISRRVTGSNANTITFATALPAAVAAGDAYSFLPIVCTDSFHPNPYGTRRIAAFAEIEIPRLLSLL